MTPMLILLFGVKPSTAISSDLVAAVLMRPVGAAVHLRRGTVNLRLVGAMVAGSVPMAFLGAYLLHLMGSSSAAEKRVQTALGIALLVGSAAMLLRFGLDRRSGEARSGVISQVPLRFWPTLVIGMIGGLIVGFTSVGSGSLMIVLLLFVYPTIGANQLVGTDLTQAVPLDRRRRPRCARVRARRDLGHHLADPRQHAGGAGRVVPVVARARPLCPSGHHVRYLRVRLEVRRRRHASSRVGAVRGAVRRGRLLAGLRATVVDGARSLRWPT